MKTSVSEMESIMERIHDGVRRGKFTMHDVQDAVVNRSREMIENTDEYVHDHPWTAIAIGVGVGVAAGMLIGNTTANRDGAAAVAPAGTEKRATSDALQSTLLFVLSTIKAVQAFRGIKFF